MWGPFSERFGRRAPLFTGFLIFLVFQVPVAVAQNIETIIVCRFFQGLFGCAPLAIVGGMMADIWNPVERGVATTFFAAATFIGPVAGPIAGGFITQSYLGWRWTQWITLIMGAFFMVIAFLIVPETYPPVLLTARARRLRHETKNWALHSAMEETEFRAGDLVTKYLLRPIKMLVLEPILLLITLYMSLLYGTLYLFFEAYPISFQEQRGWNLGVGALPFLGLTTGVVLAGLFIIVTTKTRYASKLAASGGIPVPEERLPPMMLGAVLLPLGLFTFAWTSNPKTVHTWVPQVVAGGVPIGFGIFCIFLQGLNYIIDVYLMNANSAIAGNTVMRSIAGAGFPLFATQMYHKLGVDWATTLLAILCACFAPVPILFFIYGARIRGKSRWSPTF